MVRYMPFLFSPEIRTENSAFFAAMNTPKGFVSEFESLFSSYHTYMIKGGPGTGKSTMMRKLAKEAELRGIPVSYYYCSSDPTSLDAITLDTLNIAVLDATLPHAIEPSLVGIKDFYLDLAQFVTPDIRRNKEEIEKLTCDKKEAYERAYLLLKALSAADQTLESLRRDTFCYEKCQKILTRLVDRLGLKAENTPTEKHLPASAIGCAGYIAIDSYHENTCTDIEITDRYGIAHYVFHILRAILKERRISYRYSLSPLTMTPDTLWIGQKNILISSLPLSKAPALTINCERFLKERGQGLYKGQKAIVTSEKLLFAEAKEAFSKAGEAHKKIEALYRPAMNFTALNSYTSALIREIFPH